MVVGIGKKFGAFEVKDGGTMAKVFVYGTLRKGYGNHDRLMGEARYLRDGETRPEYTMIHLGGFPGVIHEGTTAIKGEVYEVKLATLQLLDQLEGHPHFYKRTRIKLNDESEVLTYIYQLPMKNSEIQAWTIKSGDWNVRGGVERR